MSPASAMKAKPTASKVPVVASDKLPRTKVWGETDPAVSWAGAFAVTERRHRRPSSTRSSPQEERRAEAPGSVDQQRIIEARPKSGDWLALERRHHIKRSQRQDHCADQDPARPIGRSPIAIQERREGCAPNSAPERLGDHRRHAEWRNGIERPRRKVGRG